MFSDIEHGRCRISFEGFESFTSNLMDLFNFLELFLDETGVITCGEEGSTFDVVINWNNEFYIVSNRDNQASAVFSSEKTVPEILKEVISDIETQFDKVVLWFGELENQELYGEMEIQELVEKRPEWLLESIKLLKLKYEIYTLTDFFDSISNEINYYNNKQKNSEQNLSEFANNLLKQCENVVFQPNLIKFNPEEEVKYWIEEYENEEKEGNKRNKSLYEECAENLVFSILCNIDGCCFDNDYTFLQTIFDNRRELHAEWCDYLKNKA